MSSIHSNLTRLQAQLPPSVTLVAVSKTKPVSMIQEVYQYGQRDFGENKVQELCEKQPLIPSDIRWHLIGHLQTNKVKYIAPFVHLIHSVDSLKLLSEINKQAEKNNRTINCLLQVYIASEETKFGLSEEELFQLLRSPEYMAMKHITVAGLMGMASNTSNAQQVRNEFKSLKKLFEEVKKTFFPNQDTFKELSMGMSGDYLTAIEEGSTMIRVGSSLFGER
ncbi:MAG: YggS family pyridoxal phosphate-dependent enzyme [Bacteroidia bacterium]|nr:YggS family pyridoxal phosphate-dependent enzyme [Bacteroidia bacterium]